MGFWTLQPNRKIKTVITNNSKRQNKTNVNDKAGAKCHLHTDAGRHNCHKCCELALNGKGITESGPIPMCEYEEHGTVMCN